MRCAYRTTALATIAVEWLLVETGRLHAAESRVASAAAVP